MGRRRRGESIVAALERKGRRLNPDTPVARKPRLLSIRVGAEEMLLTVQGCTRFLLPGRKGQLR